jgi:hypothetical protein
MRMYAKSLSLLVALSGAAQAADAPVTKEVTGEAPIIDGNRQRAQEVAKDAALRTAVEQVAGTIISATTLTQNSQLISDQILSHSSGYVSHWEPVGKPVEEAGVIKVTVRATVQTAQLDKDLQAVQALITRLGNRKLVILTQEQTLDSNGKIYSSDVMASVLTEVFKQDGWTIIDPHFAAGKLKLGSGVGPAEVKEIGELSKADYILYGNVNYKEQAPDGMMKGAPIYPVSGEYHLALFATDSGTQLTDLSGKFNSGPEDLGKQGTLVVSYQRSAFDITRHRGTAVVSEVRGKVVAYLQAGQQNGNRVVMNVVGLSEYSAVQGFKRVLADSITGVRQVNPGSFGNGKAQFDITFVGSTDDLAERIGGKTFKGKKINVTGVSPNSVEVTLAK